jgi:hypothetical protein
MIFRQRNHQLIHCVLIAEKITHESAEVKKDDEMESFGSRLPHIAKGDAE